MTGTSEALYRRVKDYVARQIADGTWKPGDRVPSEHALVDRFGVSRMTVNRALRELAGQGTVVRVAGVGTFVADEKPQSTLLRIASIADEIRARGHDYRCDLVDLSQESATREVAHALEIEPGRPVFHSVCVHHEDGVPVQLEDRYVNPASAPDFLLQDFDDRQPGEFLLRTVPFDQIEHVVEARLPSREQAERLRMPISQPCLLLTRRTWNQGVAVTFVRCLHPGSRYRLGSRFFTDGRTATV